MGKFPPATDVAPRDPSSRVLDAVLESDTVPKTAKRKFVMTFIGHYHVLVDDRIGSRVGDRCWASADPYLKVRPHTLFHRPFSSESVCV